MFGACAQSRGAANQHDLVAHDRGARRRWARNAAASAASASGGRRGAGRGGATDALAKISAAQAPDGPPPTTATRSGRPRSIETAPRELEGAGVAPMLRPRAEAASVESMVAVLWAEDARLRVRGVGRESGVVGHGAVAEVVRGRRAGAMARLSMWRGAVRRRVADGGDRLVE